jgi:hypothetical protein
MCEGSRFRGSGRRRGIMRKLVAALASVAAVLPIAVAGAALSTTVVVDYDPALGQLPEGVAVDKRGDVFTSLSPLG